MLDRLADAHSRTTLAETFLREAILLLLRLVGSATLSKPGWLVKWFEQFVSENRVDEREQDYQQWNTGDKRHEADKAEHENQTDVVDSITPSR